MTHATTPTASREQTCGTTVHDQVVLVLPLFPFLSYNMTFRSLMYIIVTVFRGTLRPDYITIHATTPIASRELLPCGTIVHDQIHLSVVVYLFFYFFHVTWPSGLSHISSRQCFVIHCNQIGTRPSKLPCTSSNQCSVLSYTETRLGLDLPSCHVHHQINAVFCRTLKPDWD